MNAPPTCNQWARLVQVAEANNIEFTYVEHLGEPYKIDRHKRLVYLDGDTELGYHSYMALAAALTQLTHENVLTLPTARTAPVPRSLRTS